MRSIAISWGEQCRRAQMDVWAYCLTPNHVHLILTPKHAGRLGDAVGEAHKRYINFINARGRWTGHLFQSRLSSVVMDGGHLRAAICYVSLHPVGAGPVAHAEDRPWSSVRAHLAGRDDALVKVRPVPDRMPSFAEDESRRRLSPESNSTCCNDRNLRCGE